MSQHSCVVEGETWNVGCFQARDEEKEKDKDGGRETGGGRVN